MLRKQTLGNEAGGRGVSLDHPCGVLLIHSSPPSLPFVCPGGRWIPCRGHRTPLPWLYAHSLFFDAGVVLKQRLVKTNHLLLKKNEKKGKKSSLLSLCPCKLPKALLLREGTSGVLSARQPREHQRSQGPEGWVGGWDNVSRDKTRLGSSKESWVLPGSWALLMVAVWAGGGGGHSFSKKRCCGKTWTDFFGQANIILPSAFPFAWCSLYVRLSLFKFLLFMRTQSCWAYPNYLILARFHLWRPSLFPNKVTFTGTGG